jgi:hypothetical protein
LARLNPYAEMSQEYLQKFKRLLREEMRKSARALQLLRSIWRQDGPRNVSFGDYHDSGFDPAIFESFDNSDFIWLNDSDWCEATTRFWYHKF